MKNRSLVYLLILFSITPTLNCQNKGDFVDNRDGHTYKWIQIGQQIWMAENMAYLPKVSSPIFGVKSDEKNIEYCYVYDYLGNSTMEAIKTSNYKTFGALYNWKMALNACPAGWHLPTDEEFFILEKKAGMSDIDLNEIFYRMSGSVGNLLKSKSSWIEDGNGIDKFEFSALPGGFRHNGDLSTPNPQGGFGFLGKEAFFWTSTSTSNTTAIRRQLSSSSKGMVRFSHEKDQGYSVRCVKD